MLYLDSADRDQLAPLLATGLFEGVTTNPLILQRAGLGPADLPDLVQWSRGQGCRRFFAQATGASLAEIRASAAAVAALGDDVVVKLVCTLEGLTVAKELTAAGRKVLITAVYHPAQMLPAVAAGAHFIAPYIGRATDAGRDGLALVRAMAQVADGTPRILAASLRSVDQLAEAAAAGAHDATLSTEIANALLDDGLTRSAAAEFEAATATTASAV
ncbi:transaldolase family protein [Arthrobacter sp. USHLN218]|uniref:transaldolase family protein n=1 Tax=Arthrobacter sp. USHLN218 TaxID=3081232 RepID=UPI00301761AB